MWNSVEFEVYGDYALFSDPATRIGGEKFTFQVPTYEAIKGVLSSIYWKPTIIWIVDEVRVMKQIQTETQGIRTVDYNTKKNVGGLSYYTYLKDCDYQVRAHFIWNDNRPELAHDRNDNKHFDMAKRAIRQGGRRDIFLGTRECQGYVRPCKFGEGVGYYDNVPELEYGNMYHGITYPDEAYPDLVPETKGCMSVRFGRVTMRNGVIKFMAPWECAHKKVRDMEMKVFKDKKNFKSIEEEA